MMNLTYLGFSGPRIDWSGTSTGRKLELKLENLHKSLFSGSLKPRLLKILIKVLTQQQIGLHTASSSMSDTLPLMMLTKVACQKIKLNRKNARKCTKGGAQIQNTLIANMTGLHEPHAMACHEVHRGHTGSYQVLKA